MGRLAGMLLLAVTAPLTAQSLAVAPQVIAIDSRSGTGAVTLLNQGSTAAEITLSTLYGFPVTDSVGRMTLQTFEAAPDTAPSAAGWIRIFPRRLLLAPGARRTVRLLVESPRPLSEGERWARLVISSRQGRVPVSGLQEASGVTVALDLEVRTLIPVFYRHGAVRTGVRLSSLEAHREGDSLLVRPALTREGNAAFVGAMRATLRDASGQERASLFYPFGVYYTLEPAFRLPVADIPAGRYQLSLEVATSRPDVPTGAILAAAPLTRTIPVDLP